MPFDGLLRPRGSNPLNQLPQGQFELDRSHPLAVGLIGLWPLNGDGRDYSRGGHNGSLVGSPPTVISSSGPVPKLDGSTQYVTIPAPGWSYANITLAGWFYSAANQNTFTGGVYSRASTIPAGFGFGYGGGTNQIGYYWGNNEHTWNSGLFLTNSAWTFVGLVLTPAGGTIYANLQRATLATANSVATFNGSVQFGNDTVLPNRVFNGPVANFVAYNRALLPAEMARLYAEPCGMLVPVRRRSYRAPVSSAISIDVAEAGAAADAIALSGSFLIQESESGAAVDTGVDIARAGIAEVGTGVDTATAVAQAAITESGTAVDSVAAAGFAAVSISEAGSAADADGTAAPVAITEAGVALDGAALAATPVIAATETGIATDAASMAGRIVVTESGGAIEAFAASQSASMSVGEAAAAVDSVSMSGGVPVFSISETGAAAESVSGSGFATSEISELGVAADSESVSTQGSVAETGAALDGVAIAAGVSLSETGAAIDAGRIAGQASVAESGAATDAFAGIYSASIPISEAGTAIDGFTATLPGTFAISVSEAATAAEATGAALLAPISILESGGAVDTAAQAVSISMSEAAAASDTVRLTATQIVAAISESTIVVDRSFLGVVPELTNAARFAAMPADVRAAMVLVDRRTVQLQVDQRAANLSVE